MFQSQKEFKMASNVEILEAVERQSKDVLVCKERSSEHVRINWCLCVRLR